MLLAAVRLGRPVSGRAAIAIECADVAVASLLMFLTEGVTSPFFVFFGFVLLETAYRWGFRETVLIGAVSVALFGAEALLASKALSFWVNVNAQFELNRFILRCTYLMLLALVVGYLAEQEKVARSEAAWLAQILARAQEAGSFAATLRLLSTELLGAMRASALYLVVEQLDTGRAFVWNLPSVDATEMKHAAAADDGEAGLWRDIPADAAGGVLVVTGDTCLKLLLVDEAEGLTSAVPIERPRFLLPSVRHVVFATDSAGDEWRARVFVVDPAIGRNLARTVKSVRVFVSQVRPVAYTAYLSERLRSRVTAAERARIARELHDGVVQSLLGVQMHIQTLQRRGLPARDVGRALGMIRETLRQETVKLRMLMFQLASMSGHASLKALLAAIVDRFEHACGIEARFTWTADSSRIPVRVCHELAQILREALTNVQKHSGATTVRVTIDQKTNQLVLVVEDDGRGFSFAGRRSHDELEAEGVGPRVISERVRLLRGVLVVDSRPGVGSRLEVSVPGQPVEPT
jgi:signal transduction histidine kinase